MYFIYNVIRVYSDIHPITFTLAAIHLLNFKRILDYNIKCHVRICFPS